MATSTTASPSTARVLALSALSVASGVVVGSVSGFVVGAALRAPHQDGWTELGNSLLALGAGAIVGVMTAVVVAWRGVRQAFAPGRRLVGGVAVASPLAIPVLGAVGADLAGDAGGLAGAGIGGLLVWAAIPRG